MNHRRCLFVCALPFLLSGCQLLGIAANAVPKPPVKPKVVLAGNSVGVMVWCDRGLRVDWPSIQKDLGGGVQVRLLEAQKAKAKELEGVTFPYPTESFIRWQRDHPGSEAEPIVNVAPRLHVTRLIYIEIENLSTRSSTAMALYRGTATASVKVIEVPPEVANATAPATQPAVGRIIFQAQNVKVVYPKHSTDDGRPEGSDDKMYVGSMTFLADEIAKMFVEHPAEDDE